jgi:uncharacterized RDD family membrane protein YckC
MSDPNYILDYDLSASSGARFLNHILDLLSVFILFFLAIVLMGIIVTILGINGIGTWIDGLGDFAWDIIALILLLFYYLITEAFFGRSLGKFVTGTIVVNKNGKKPDFGAILKRTLCRLIPFDPLSFLGSRGWHDSMSDTYVVNKKGLEESIKSFHELKLIGIQESDL